jgi:hypothetical protein
MSQSFGNWLKTGGLWLARVERISPYGAKTSSELDDCQYTNSLFLKRTSDFRKQEAQIGK